MYALHRQIFSKINSKMLCYRELAGYLDAYAIQHMMLTMTSNPGNE
jgi:hypothetical protein